MTNADEILWKAYAKGVQPLETPSPETKPIKRPPPPEESPFVSRTTEEMPVLLEKKAPPEPLDVRVERNLSLGKVIIEARLDLHGKTEEEAHALFSAFIDKQRALGRRLVLVITGKGREETGTLRKNLPRWSETPPFCDAIRAIRTAAPLHGGEGAYYVLLKRR